MVSTTTEEQWEARLGRIKAELVTLFEVSETLKQTHGASPFWRHQELFEKASKSFSCVQLVYFAGFKAIAEDATDVVVADRVHSWVKSVDRGRSAHVVASMYSSALCSSLEGFLRFVNANSLDQAVVDRLTSSNTQRTRRGNVEILSPRLDGARNQLDIWLKPSGGGAFTDWMQLVSLVFGCTLSSDVTESLADMIGFRHAITHPKDLPEEPTIDSPVASRLACWGLATTGTATKITHALVGRS